MKKLYFLFFLIIGFLGNAQIINFPDANFKAKLLAASSLNYTASTEDINNTGGVTTYTSIDTNNDGEIQVSEALAIKYLNVGPYQTSNSNITSLIGIEVFLNLQALNCENGRLVNLDVSDLTNLKRLKCNGNFFLASLDVSNLTNLEYLDCSNNQLTNLDVSDLINLIYLDCSFHQLTSLDVSDLTNLTDLDCGFGNLTSLDLTNVVNLENLDFRTNLIENLNVSDLINLKYLNCSSNNLISLDVTNLINLTGLDCGTNELNSIDLFNLINLRNLNCRDNQLTSLDVSNLTNLISLDCRVNQLNNLDVSSLTNLSSFDCAFNQLVYLNLKNNYSSNYYTWGDNPSLQYICANESNIANIQQKIDQFGYSATCHVNSYCSFTPGGTFYEISGTTKLDSNNNGCDILDINYSNLRFNITNGTVTGSTISNQTGNYYIPVQAGNHTITPNLENPSYFNISPTSFTVNFPTQTSPFTQNFCVTANGIKHDVEVILIPTVPARPGFDANYKLVYRNKGNQVENGNITLTFDDARLDYVVANPIYNSSATNSFTWNYSNLQPFETREIGIVFNVNSPMETPAVNNGDILNYTATITTANTDQTPLDNTFILDQTVVGSYDPNDKTCLEGTTIAPTEVGKYVHYVIRFENTGTYPAENIVVKDMIDLAKFDIATLVPLKSSHDFYTRINGNKVEFIFENINLDFNDATNDGYVVFKIKTLPSLVLGDTFTNNANIYFDYNFPITTNTYTTTVAALSTQDFDFGTYFTLYPNPAKDVLNIQTKQGLAINSIEIYNQLGQIVMAVTNAVNAIDVANLASGTYFVKINTQKGSANVKFVKE